MKNINKIIFSVIIFFFILFIKTSINYAQINWWPLPPYNTLWPLWSPILSPPNELAFPTPMVSSLTTSTILPVQPGLTWDPVNRTYSWLLYNTPLGMVYYDPLIGIDVWPPSHLLSAEGTPLPIDLSTVNNWSVLPPTSTTWLLSYIPLGIINYYATYPQYAFFLDPAVISDLLNIIYYQ